MLHHRPFHWLLCLSLCLSCGSMSAQETQSDAPPTAETSRATLRDKQLDISLETRDIERILTRLKRASDLSKQRITDAAVATEAVSTSIERGDSPGALKEADGATQVLKEVIQQLEALLAEETPQQLAAARKLAAQLSRTERDFARELQGALNPVTGGGAGQTDPRSQTRPKNGKGGMNPDGDQPPQPNGNNGSGSAGETKPETGENQDESDQPGQAADQPEPADKGDDKETQKSGTGNKADKEQPEQTGGGGTEQEQPQSKEEAGGAGKKAEKDPPQTEEERRQGLAEQARQMSETGRTLLDILETIAQSQDPADQGAVDQVTRVLKETELQKAVEEMQQLAGAIQGNQLADARLTALDLADRLEITAQRLDAAYRQIIAPQAEELRKLEERLSLLRDKLDNLQTEAQVMAWHRAAQDLLEEADKLGLNESLTSQFLEEMKRAGFSIDTGTQKIDWGIVDGVYRAPASYTKLLSVIQEDVQLRMQTLMLGETLSSRDEKTPPQYEDLVERYYQILSRDAGTRSANSPQKGSAGEGARSKPQP